MRRERSSRGARTLPGRYYTSAEIFDRESERIFARAWICVGVASSIPATGDYFVADVEGESVIVLRDVGGEVRAFANVCRHRGTRLCVGPAGRFSKRIVCPYHAWAYDLAGRLAAAPNMDGVAEFDPAAFPLQGVRTTVWNGLVFVSLDPAAAFENVYPMLVDRFADWSLPDLVPAHRTAYDVRCNWKLLFQNYSECYHCPSLHPVLNRLTPYRGSSNDLEQGPVLGGPMKLADGVESMTIDGRACGACLPGVSGEDRRLAYYYTVFPSLFLSLLPDYVIVHRLSRRDPGRTTVVCDWLLPADAAGQPGCDPARAVEFWDLTNRQDWAICERSQQGVASRSYVPGPYADLESLLAAFDREYRRALGDGSVGSA